METIVTDRQALEAWDTVKRYLAQNDRYISYRLDEYFKGVLSKPLPPAAPARCEELAQVWGTDEYKCPKCGVMWDRDEERPDCRI